jgi:energy-coupling factor transport system permease protein
MFHTRSWVVWLIAAAVPAFSLHNPLYLAVVLGAAWIDYTILGRSTSVGSSWASVVRIGLFFFALTIPFNALSNHMGRIILFRLPASWPIIGGPITLEAIIAGSANGLALLTILVVFAAFNAVVDHYQLLRATPAFLFQAGVIMSIAITFVPQMVLSAREIRQAQRIRGHRFRGVRDLLPLIIPLLANGLERAIQLAEAMEARGFGSAVAPIPRRWALLAQLGLLAALLGLMGGLFTVAVVPEQSGWGWMLAAAGSAGVLAILSLKGRQVRRTRYRRLVWTWRDTAVVIASTVVLVVVMAAKLAMPNAMTYSPFPPNELLPSFQPLVGAALLLLALPALVAPGRTRPAAGDTAHAAGNTEVIV